MTLYQQRNDRYEMDETASRVEIVVRGIKIVIKQDPLLSGIENGVSVMMYGDRKGEEEALDHAWAEYPEDPRDGERDNELAFAGLE